MARNVTLANLIADIRCQYETFTISISDVVLTRWINQSIAALYDLIISVCPDEYLTSSTVSVVSGTSTYALPATFYRAHGVDVLDSDGKYKRMEPFCWEERNFYNDTNASREATRYRIMGSNLHLAPTPGWSGTIKIWFVPAATLLVNTTDTWDGCNGWEEWVIVDVCIKCALKEENSISGFAARKKELTDRIEGLAKTRDFSNPDRVRDAKLGRINELTRPWNTLPKP